MTMYTKGTGAGGAARALISAAVAAVALTLAPRALAQESADDIPGAVAIDLRDDLAEAEIDALAAAEGITPLPSSFLSARTHVFTVSLDPSRAASLMAKLQGDPRVELVEPVARVHASWQPNDPLLTQQWHLARVGAPKAWSYATGRGVTVAIVDTGIACEDHGPYTKGSDLANTWCLTGFDFVNNTPHANDDHGHGSHVAGTVAQSTNNGLGAAGLAFHARLLPVKVLDKYGMGTTVAVADGIRYAADAGAHVINLSLGSSRASALMRKAVDYARSQGVVVVAAAGNNGRYVEYPGAFDGVIAVSATDAKDELAGFSSRGPQVDIAAPGVAVTQQTICNGGRNKCERFPELSGTSMASPHVAGAAALLVSLGVTNPAQVESVLLSTAREVNGNKKGGPLFGAGILDAGAAVARATWTQAIARFVLLALLTTIVAVRIRRKGGFTRLHKPLFWVSALAFGPGLAVFLPAVASRVPLPFDLLARPIPEWDLLVSASVHRWLPLATFLTPLVLSAVTFGIRWMRPAIGGVALGTASYVLSVAGLGLVATTFKGTLMLGAWALVNAFICGWLARVALDEKD